ncbi:asparagine synthase (glutamine-hydrolyzing) [Seonamhaeicola aphaedonensis]|uniref:asparagine synthase (glutamine-hydrolyzing) n=1 Tax=Seonamhaeicola aphaedonensis TaxID=1461338 RepID=A0A3D9HFU0_9FLAO|nr:asparagine synthase (glutamine-hydrolyzing) [Seonamhaeicola aphaedonensis]RED48362.1 asparagine synthase (glutamine-hydrolysing) [Seonamhaeicola aphaedonensis]
MCGFLTEFSFNNHAVTDSTVFEQLLQLSQHRGPDNTTINTQQNYRLGFNRLAILDLSAQGNQPKFSPSQRYHVVFNGEIYNYKALKDQYQLTNLNSSSDTEVLIHLLDILGVEDTLKALNGMFAMVIMDTVSQTLYLARDFAGIKPLFYGVSKNGVVAASQFNQIFKHPWFQNSLALKPEVVKAYFGFGYMQSPHTIFKQIFQVNPGEYIKIDNKQQITTVKFQEFFQGIKPNISFDIANTETVLKEAVSRQLVSDVPLASFLSGGIDSPLITAMAKTQKADLEAFTLSVNDDQLDEGKQAEIYAKALGIKQEIHKVNEGDLLEEVNNHFKYLGEPFGDYSSIPTYVITKKAKQRHTVMLSGDGGDELFFGYPRMLDVVKNRRWFNIPFYIRKPLIRVANKLKLNNTWGPFHYKTIGEWVMGKHRYIFKEDLNTFFKDVTFSKDMEALYGFEWVRSKKGLLGRLRYNEFYGHLQRVLIKVDRMSMANSLEVRVPFLDKAVLAEVHDKLPVTYNSKADLKKLLKDLMLNYYTIDSINHHKKGFAVPMYDWLHNQLKSDVETMVFKKTFYGSDVINVEAVKAYVKKFYNKEHDAAWGIWHIYAWQKWAQAEDLI